MQDQSSLPVKTFTIGFYEEEFSEIYNARRISEYLGTDHTEMIIDSNNLINVIPSISKIYDEPFADSSQIPTFLVSQLALDSDKYSELIFVALI